MRYFTPGREDTDDFFLVVESFGHWQNATKYGRSLSSLGTAEVQKVCAIYSSALVGLGIHFDFENCSTVASRVLLSVVRTKGPSDGSLLKLVNLIVNNSFRRVGLARAVVEGQGPNCRLHAIKSRASQSFITRYLPPPMHRIEPE